ncbi:C-C motif chemokine 3-like 1 [Emys orbicularis]|uniref:C-C motif chemokine 3-like 1 n=1 Tax=Emys orbicularis TaxID=82168 RepID=UPI0031FBBB83
MKVSVAAIVFVLSMACCSQASIEEKNFETSWSSNIACCFTYTSRQIPRRFVVDYFVTSSPCSLPAVIFITTKGRQVCTNPKDAWVQQYMKDLK